ncbi:MAG TPA: universal stress protein [Dissulfurispiraceae bacterium]|nr:universal stress protein [Dissulfurispiraceae bacterium]
MYENIVVAFDGFDFSRAALQQSAKWVRTHGGRITLLHAVFFDEQEFAIAPDQRETRFEFGKKICLQTKSFASAELGLNGNLEALICEGEPHEVIVDVAAARKADLIAMGTHGSKGLKKLIMGSVASKVIRIAPCDVLVAKKPCDCPGNYRSILCSYDGTEYSKKALAKACEIARIEGAGVTALYVIPRYEEMVEFFRSGVIRENLRHDANKIVQGAVDIARKSGVGINTEIAEGNAPDGIIETAKKIRSDLVVIGTHGWSGINKAIIGSVAEDVIVGAPCPVLIVRQTKSEAIK